MRIDSNDLSELDELTEEQLGFSALSEGLGLTRAPKKAGAMPPAEEMHQEEKLRAMSMSGIGAVAAGPARPVLAKPAPKSAAKAAATQTVANPLSEPAASRFSRVCAFTIDLLFVAIPIAMAWRFSLGEASLELLLLDWVSPAILFSAMFATYFLLSESFGGQSMGKMLLGLRVVEDDKYQKPTGFKHAAARLVLFVAGIALGGIGLLASFWDFKRRPWHDRLSGSIVRKKA